jgi:hypothetical protein
LADLHNLRDRHHGQATAVGGADRLIALRAQALGRALEGGLALGVVASEGGELGAGLGSLATAAGDRPIVGPIFTNELV